MQDDALSYVSFANFADGDGDELGGDVNAAAIMAVDQASGVAGTAGREPSKARRARFYVN